MTPWTAARQAPVSMEFSRQAYWGGWPFPPPRDLPNPEIGRRSPTLQVDSLPSEAPGKPSPHRGRVTTGPRLPCHPHTASADPRIIITSTPHTPLTPIYFLFFLIGGSLLSNAVLVSTVRQHESALCTHVSLPSEPPPLPAAHSTP